MTLNDAFKIRFNELLKEKSITVYKFVKDNCIARSTLVNILNGNTKNPFYVYTLSSCSYL